VSPRELATLLGVGKYVAYQLAGRLGVRIGRGRILVPMEAVKRFLRGELQPDSPPPSTATSGTPKTSSTAAEVKAE